MPHLTSTLWSLQKHTQAEEARKLAKNNIVIGHRSTQALWPLLVTFFFARFPQVKT